MEAYRRLAAVTTAGRRRRRARRVDRPLRTAAAARGGAARRRAPARRVPAPRHPRGLGAEGPGPTRRLGAAEVAGSAAASGCPTAVQVLPDVGDRAGRRDAPTSRSRRRCSGCSARSLQPTPRYDPPNETFPRALRRGRRDRARRFGAVRAPSPTPPPSTYTQKGTSAAQLHVTRADLLSEVGKIVANKPFATWLKAEQVRGQLQRLDRHAVSARSGCRSSSTSRPSTRCSRRATSRSRRRSRRAGRQGRRATSSRRADIFPAFDCEVPGHAHRPPGAHRSAARVVHRHVGRRRSEVLRRAQVAVRVRVGQERRAHPRRDAGRGPGRSSISSRRARRSRRSRSRTRPTRRAAPQGGVARLPHGRRVRARVPERGRGRAVRHADRAGALAVRLPRHPGDARDTELRRRRAAGADRRWRSRVRPPRRPRSTRC